LRTISGDLIHLAKRGEFDLIAHGCNCFTTMGAGIAKGIRAVFPEAFEADLATARGDRGKLGTCSHAEVVRNDLRIVIVNAYTQYDYRGSGTKLDYDALRGCMGWIKERYSGLRIGLPKIGAGLAGGDWLRIADIITEALPGEDVTIVEFKPVD
jgi:O-acetyl-ADP-ribose deacetylase (regulator of RNase III)